MILQFISGIRIPDKIRREVTQQIASDCNLINKNISRYLFNREIEIQFDLNLINFLVL